MQYYIALFVRIFFDLLSFLIIVRILLSWFPGAVRAQRAIYILQDITDPVLGLAKKITPNTGMFDFSPVIALIGLDLLKAFSMYLLSFL